MKYSWRVLEFDSRIFGLTFAKVLLSDSGDHTDEDIAILINELVEQGVSYASVRIPMTNLEAVHQFEKNSFVLVDSLVGLSKKINYQTPDPIENENIRRAKIEDLEMLKQIAEDSMVENRFYRDAFFKKMLRKVRKIYSGWIENSFKKIAADEVLVYLKNNIPVGFIVLENSGHIPLIAVSQEHRGSGIASALIQHAVGHFKRDKISLVLIEAVLGNISAIRTYEANGFKMTGGFYTLAWHNDHITSHN